MTKKNIKKTKKEKLQVKWELVFSGIQTLAVIIVTFIASVAYFSDIPKLLENRLNAEITESKIDLNDTKLELREAKSQLDNINNELTKSRNEAELYYTQVRRDVVLGIMKEFNRQAYSLNESLITASQKDNYYAYIDSISVAFDFDMKAKVASDVAMKKYYEWARNVNSNNARLARKGIDGEGQMADSIKRFGEEPEQPKNNETTRFDAIINWNGGKAPSNWILYAGNLTSGRYSNSWGDKEVLEYKKRVAAVKSKYFNNMKAQLTGKISGMEILNNIISEQRLNALSQRHKKEVTEALKQFELANRSLLSASYKFESSHNFTNEEFRNSVQIQTLKLKKLRPIVRKFINSLRLSN